MSLIEALLQGILQGLTEFLPVSSSGHLSLFQYFTGQSGETGILFSILLHLGTLIAVFLAFYKTIFQLIFEFFAMVGDIFGGRFSFKKLNPDRRMILMLMLSLVPLLFFVLLSDFYKSISSDNDIIAEGVCFLFTGVLLLFSDKIARGNITMANMRPRDALVMGIAQGIAPLPGVSRSGSTVAAGLMMGLEREYAVTFSFIMGMPAVLGANLLEFADIWGEPFPISVPVMLAGVSAAVVFGLIAIKMVQWLVHTNKFKYFGYYTLALGSIIIILGIIENNTGHAIQRMIAG